ncbi:hypothetical protein EJ04DRAFT_516702 [Polyplosphaeria fusca]|uniref:Uncharacterized protein n=1 Tax=Polyplosphaeria fusca TaxID=682080 RepID=A0A9P4QP18_9PLEO|nr:hypothetical protein EJ04DRAFT_516702 [Polyplosphaeria fusca]
MSTLEMAPDAAAAAVNLQYGIDSTIPLQVAALPKIPLACIPFVSDGDAVIPVRRVSLGISIVRDVSGYPVPYNPGKVGWSYPGRLWSPPTAISDLSSTILSVFRRLIVVVGLGYDHVGARFDIDGSGTCTSSVRARFCVWTRPSSDLQVRCCTLQVHRCTHG